MSKINLTKEQGKSWLPLETSLPRKTFDITVTNSLSGALIHDLWSSRLFLFSFESHPEIFAARKTNLPSRFILTLLFLCCTRTCLWGMHATARRERVSLEENAMIAHWSLFHWHRCREKWVLAWSYVPAFSLLSLSDRCRVSQQKQLQLQRRETELAHHALPHHHHLTSPNVTKTWVKALENSWT